MSDFTRAIARLIQTTPDYHQLGLETKGNLKKGVLDYFISCYASVKYDPNFQNVVNTAIYTGCDEVVVIGTERRVHPFDACLINGYSAHALDLDDVHSEIRGHPSAVILSLLFSLREEKKDMNSIYEAYLVGIEVMTRCAKLLGTEHYEKGFHTTATAGVYGAVAAGVHYLGFSIDQMAQALNLCVSKISGSRSHFGTLIKPLHAGLAAQSAWQVLHFVKNNVTGSENTILSKNGLLSMYNEKEKNPWQMLEKWGEPWAIDTPGLWFKLYPCCSANAHPIDAVMNIKKRHSFTSAEVASVDLFFPPKGDAALVYTHPENGEQGRFSAEYCTALILLERDLSIENFTVNSISAEVQDMMGKIKRKYDENIPKSENSYPKGRYCIAEISLLDGQRFVSRVDAPTGSPGKPLEMEDLLNKAATLLGNQAEFLIEHFSAEVESWGELL
ncbi:2-methylcitrate dehydratase PrpD [Neobacillus niacini]|uniref:MmgE/PrpD family protein n=1 Tax=Neobacillus niacini TaxID=86668 RepID=UPI0028585F81|nr:MmgE/PrpD family protein [Neobacillus niacini]MDR7080308.1 2-methylcitrate dehydratase PrpD [Neobacillus niacini]